MNQQQLINAGRQLDLARIPVWSGVKDAVFTPEQWIDRIEKAKGANAGAWTNDTTMSYVYNALRGDALTWYEALPTLGYDNADWDDFKAAFLRTYGVVYSPLQKLDRIACKPARPCIRASLQAVQLSR